MPFYIRQCGRHVSGPFDTGDIREWVKEGRINEDFELSQDRTSWQAPSETPRVGSPKRTSRRR